MSERSINVFTWLDEKDVESIEEKEKKEFQNTQERISKIELNHYLKINKIDYPYAYIDTISMPGHSYVYYCTQLEFEMKQFGYDDWYEFPIHALLAVLEELGS